MFIKKEITIEPRIHYSEYYVAFLDVLGFKDLVLSDKDEEKIKLEKYFYTTKK